MRLCSYVHVPIASRLAAILELHYCYDDHHKWMIELNARARCLKTKIVYFKPRYSKY